MKQKRIFIELNKIYRGDSLEVLKTFPDECVDCVVTSPPYWALRDYGIDGQLGLEKTFEEYINKLCGIYDEVKRVLKKTGTCFVNLGDTYYGGGRNRGGDFSNMSIKQRTNRGTRDVDAATSFEWSDELSKKCLCQIPYRFSIEMVKRGWILRNILIWHKPNAMPSSITDRFSVDYEPVFFFTKSKKYLFDMDAVREPHGQDKRMAGLRRAREFGYDGKGSYQDWYNNKRKKKDWVNKKETGDQLIYYQAKRLAGANIPDLIHPIGRAKRSVWSITTQGYKGAHFATFPQKLIEPMIKAGCPRGGVCLDPFMGSGTTAYVARELGRNYVGIELNKDYIKLAEKRLEQMVLL